jgi:hypothetical protein
MKHSLPSIGIPDSSVGAMHIGVAFHGQKGFLTRDELLPIEK